MSAWIEANLNPRLAAVWLDVLLKSFVVLAFAGGFCLVWRRAAAATRHLIWFLGVVGLLLLPLLPFVLPATPRPLWTVSGGHVSGNEIALSLELGPVQRTSALAESVITPRLPISTARETGRPLFRARLSHDWLSLGLGAWVLGALAGLLAPVLGRIQLLRMEKNSDVLATSEWVALLAEASHLLGLRRRVVLLQSRASVMPLTWGWLWPKVLLPVEATGWPEDRRRMVLLHELAHVKRRDCLTQSITRIACAWYWFNPLVWIAARQMRIERERACDDLVLNGGCKASDYAGHLVEIAMTFRRAPQGAGIAMARGSNLERRVTAIVDVSRARRLRPAGLVGILVSIAAVVFYIGGYKTSAAADGAKSDAAKQETLAQIEKFSVEKEAQARLLAAAAGETIMPEFQKYFDAAKKGDFKSVTNAYADFKKYHPQYSHDEKNMRPAYRTSYWQPMLEICLIYDQFASSDSKFTREAAHDMINSIPPGSIYFGGTDPGRGLPTAFSKSQVNADPFYVLSQNPLSDPTYEEYLQRTYGEERRMLVRLAAARQADPELSALDKEYQAAEQKALSLEMSKPADGPERRAADQAWEDLYPRRSKVEAGVLKTVQANENSPATNSWSKDKVIYIPSFEDQNQAFQNYMEDAKKRLEEKRLKPGEDVRMDANGHLLIGGQVAVQAINARFTKLIFDKNPGHEFYVEESFPHDWMYPHLEPNGLILKINREPLAELPDDMIQKDLDYWQSRVDGWLGNWLRPETPVEVVADFAEKTYGRKNLDGFTGDPDFVRDAYAPKMYSKWRSGIAGVYAWRLGSGPADLTPEYAPKSDAERQKLARAADFAFKQAFAICPYSPEVVFRYVNFLVKSGRKLDALSVARAAAKVDPSNAIFREAVKGLSAELNSLPKDESITLAAETAERLKQLQILRVQKEAEYARQEALYEKLKSLSRTDLRKALPIVVTDNKINDLLSELDEAQQHRIRFQVDYPTNHPTMVRAQAVVDDLNQKINDRIEGSMLGLEARLNYSKSYLDTVTKDIEELRAGQAAR